MLFPLPEESLFPFWASYLFMFQGPVQTSLPLGRLLDQTQPTLGLVPPFPLQLSLSPSLYSEFDDPFPPPPHWVGEPWGQCPALLISVGTECMLVKGMKLGKSQYPPECWE